VNPLRRSNLLFLEFIIWSLRVPEEWKGSGISPLLYLSRLSQWHKFSGPPIYWQRVHVIWVTHSFNLVCIGWWGSTWVTLWLMTLWHWPTTMSQVSFYFFFHNIFLFLCTRVTLWLANVTNVTNHNVTQVLS